MANKTQKNVFKLAVLACCWLALSSVSLAAEYYVSTTGDDTTGSGSITSPYRSIQHVLDNVVVSGDTITLRSGTYNENIRIRKANITIKSMTGEWEIGRASCRERV